MPIMRGECQRHACIKLGYIDHLGTRMNEAFMMVANMAVILP